MMSKPIVVSRSQSHAAWIAGFLMAFLIYPGAASQDRLLTSDVRRIFPEVITDTSTVLLADVDGDGDALIANVFQDEVYLSLTGQIARREVPRSGMRLTIDIIGPTSGWWRLAGSAHRDTVPLPPLGAILIDRNSVFKRASGALDSNGRAAASFQVPAWPALAGVTLYWQAVVGPPTKLTNLEITTFLE